VSGALIRSAFAHENELKKHRVRVESRRPLDDSEKQISSGQEILALLKCRRQG
jgi:hypothetical protein